MAAMKHGNAWAIGLLALTLSACGGNGSNDRKASTNTDDLGLTGDYRVEAVLTDPSLDPDYRFQDPLNLQAGDNVTFQLVNYSGSGASAKRSVVPTQSSAAGGVSFTTNDTTARAGSLSPTDGIFTAASTDSGSRQYIVTARYRGAAFNALYQINPRVNQVRVRGKVVDSGTNGVYNAVVEFYEPRNPKDTASRQVVVASVRTAVDGTFRASVPIPQMENTLDVSTGDDATPPAITYTVRPPDGYGTTFTAPTLDSNSGFVQRTFTVGALFDQSGTAPQAGVSGNVGTETQPTLALLTDYFLTPSLVDDPTTSGPDYDQNLNPLTVTLRSGDFYLARDAGLIVLSDASARGKK